MKHRLLFLWQHPFAPLIPWAGVALGLLFVLVLAQNFGAATAQANRERLENFTGRTYPISLTGLMEYGIAGHWKKINSSTLH